MSLFSAPFHRYLSRESTRPFGLTNGAFPSPTEFDGLWLSGPVERAEKTVTDE
jgi:hypothetical protein